MVSTHLKNISQIGSSPQIGVKKKNIWNHLAVKVTFGPLPQQQKLRYKSWPLFHSGMFCSGVQPFSTKDFVRIWTDSKELSSGWWITYPLKIDPWKRRFLLESTIFRGELLNTVTNINKKTCPEWHMGQSFLFIFPWAQGLLAYLQCVVLLTKSFHTKYLPNKPIPS